MPEVFNHTDTSSRQIVIEAGRTERHYWADVWRYRELLQMLAMRDILVRYKQTTIGVAWALIRPLLTMVAFTLVFSHLARLPSGDVPYPILVMAGLLPWQFFSSAFSESSNSLIANSNLLTKVYFPRLIVPASTVIVCLIDFLISFVIMLALMIIYRFPPAPQIFFLPLFLLLAIITALGTGVLISALNVKYRDFRYIIPFIVQFGLYASPVAFSSADIYESSRIPQVFKFIYSLNPMVGVIDGFRWSILGDNIKIYWQGFIISVCISIFFLVLGIWYFRRMEKSFADVV